MTIPLTRFLADFSTTAPPMGVVEAFDDPVLAPVDPVAERIADACREAVAEAELHHARLLEDAQSEHAAELAAARHAWAEQEGNRIATALSEQIRRLEDGIAGTLAELLEPFVIEGTRHSAVTEFRTVLAGLLAKAGDVVVTVSGPSDLTDAVRSSYSGAARLVVQNADVGDLAVQAGETQIRTQLEAWTERLRASLRAHP